MSETEALRLGTTERKLNRDAVHQGVERECPHRPGLTVTILPAGNFNPRFRRAVQRWALKRMTSENGRGPRKELRGAEDADLEEIGSEMVQDPEFVAAALVADMDGLYNPKGNKVQYTEERGRAILSDPGNEDVLFWVIQEAQQYGQFYERQVEADAGN